MATARWGGRLGKSLSQLASSTCSFLFTFVTGFVFAIHEEAACHFPQEDCFVHLALRKFHIPHRDVGGLAMSKHELL